MISVVIADDSPTAREMLRGILEGDGGIEVAGEAANGFEAVEMVEALRPSLVIMDVNMPLMNGFEATKEVMIRFPTPTLIMTGEYEIGDPVFAGNSFRCGALSAMPKVPNTATPEFDDAAEQLLQAIRQMASARVSRHWRYAPVLFQDRHGSVGVRVVGITVSHRGAGSLRELIAKLPNDFAAPLLVIPQLGHGFRDGFTAWLNRSTKLDVRIARPGDVLEPATVYLAPENFHMGVNPESNPVAIALCSAPPLRGFRPSSSYLFSSLADAYGPAAVALYLNGLPDDSLLGLCAIRLGGGRVLAEGCGPRSTGDQLCQGLADAVLSIEQIASQLAEVVCAQEIETESAAMTGAGAKSGSHSLRLA